MEAKDFFSKVNPDNGGDPMLNSPFYISPLKCEDASHGKLKLIKPNETRIFYGGNTCRKCSTRLAWKFWYCPICYFGICFSCRPLVCPQPNHGQLKITPPAKRGYVNPCFCDTCQAGIVGSSWHCSACQYDVCSTCKPLTTCECYKLNGRNKHTKPIITTSQEARGPFSK